MPRNRQIRKDRTQVANLQNTQKAKIKFSLQISPIPAGIFKRSYPTRLPPSLHYISKMTSS
jgi:hypothetical protein